MKKKLEKGFTLIEILGVVILIGILALIIFPFAERSLQSGKDKALIQMQESIILAAKNWATDHKEELPGDGDSITVNLHDLQEEGYIDEDIKNPVTGELLGDICIRILSVQKSKKMTYEYEYIENCSEYTGGEPPGGPTNDDTFILTCNDASSEGSSDGLYIDEYESGRCIYRGSNPDNYITFNDELWRIMSIESDGTLKIMRNGALYDDYFFLTWDPDEWWSYYTTSSDTSEQIPGVLEVLSTVTTRYSSVLTDYCTLNGDSYYGCNAWGSRTTTLNSNGNNVTTMPWIEGALERLLPPYEALLNRYLNTTFYNSIKANDKEYISNHLFNVGAVYHFQSSDFQRTLNEEKTYKWHGKIGLINVTDYIKSSLNTSCTNIYGASQSPYPCKNSNWLYKNGLTYWTITPVSFSDLVGHSVYLINNAGQISSHGGSSSFGVIPVLYLKSNITFSGKGTETNPYVIKN